MELILNGFWFALALTGFGLYLRYRWAGETEGRGRRELWRGLIALACALAILLPVISVTDDLHAAATAIEDSSYSRKALKRWRGTFGSGNGSKCSSPPAEVAPSMICCFGELRTIGHAFAPEVRTLKSASYGHDEGRAPPPTSHTLA